MSSENTFPLPAIGRVGREARLAHDPVSFLQSLLALLTRWFGVSHALVWLENKGGVAGEARRDFPVELAEEQVCAISRHVARYGPGATLDLMTVPAFGGPDGQWDASLRFAAGCPVVDRKGNEIGFVLLANESRFALRRSQAADLRKTARIIARIVRRWKADAAQRLSGRPGAEESAPGGKAPGAPFVADMDGRFLVVSQLFSELTGYSKEELLRLSLAELAAPEHEETARQITMAQAGSGAPRSHGLVLKTKAGSPLHVELATNLLFECGRPAGVLGSVSDTVALAAERRGGSRRTPAAGQGSKRASGPWRRLHQLSTKRHGGRSGLFTEFLRAGCEMLGLSAGAVLQPADGQWPVVAAFSTSGEAIPPLLPPGQTARFERCLAGGRTRQFKLAQPRPGTPFVLGQGGAYLICTPVPLAPDVTGVLCFADPAVRPRSLRRARETAEILAALLASALLTDSATHDKEVRESSGLRPSTPVRSRSELDRELIETALGAALEKGEFEPRFQPQLDMSGAIHSLEALLSWRHPKLGVLPAKRFVPLAERSGLITVLGSWVLRDACRQCADWQTPGQPPARVAVNVSSVQLARPDFFDMVLRAIADANIDPGLLELELTESLLIRDPEAAIRVMRRLRELGVSLALDDFGTGYSSLSYLHRLPLDVLKIDRSFLQGASSSSVTQSLLQTIIRLAHELGLSVVGEGVETPEQFELLARSNCDRVQGYLFSHPLPADTASALARSGKRIPVIGSRD